MNRQDLLDAKIETEGSLTFYDRFWKRLAKTFTAQPEPLGWYDVREYDLGIARNDFRIADFDDVGDVIWVIELTAGATASIKFNNAAANSFSLATWEMLRYSYTEVYITNAAQPGCTLRILYARGKWDLRRWIKEEAIVNADTVDLIHASKIATPFYLLALGPDAMFPGGVVNHAELTNVLAAQHHAKTVSAEIDHGSVGGLAGDDHVQYYNAARHTVAVHNALGIDHGSLGGLGDDDHPQYLHLNKAAQTLLQNLAVGGGVTIDTVDISAHAANADAHHAQAHTLASHSTKAHAELTNVTAAQHHARYTNAEAVTAVEAGSRTLSGSLKLSTINPSITWYDTNGALNEKDARMYWYEGGLLFRSHNDDNSVKLNLLTIAHNGNIGVVAGATVDGVDISVHVANVNAHHNQAHTLASHSTKAHTELTGVTAAQHHAKTTSGEIDHGSVGGLAGDDHGQYLNTARHDITARHPVAVIKTSQGSASGNVAAGAWALINMHVKSFFPGLSTPTGILHGYIMVGSQAASYTSQFAIYNDPAAPGTDYDVRWYYLS